jgi:hypothetical protein
VGTHFPLYYEYGPKRPIILRKTTPTPTKTQEEELYWEKDDINPNQVIYDLDNNKVIIPNTEDDIDPSSDIN